MTAPAYLVASRQGLYAVGRERWRLLVEGCFFGIACTGDAVFAFRHGSDSLGCDPNSGCVVHYVWRAGQLVEAGIVVDGLDHNVHQLDFFDGAFFVVDTLNQRVLEYDIGWSLVAAHRILPPAERDGPDHAHLNSIAGTPETVWVMLHNGNRGRPSEIVELDRAFNERGRTPLPCDGCHDIVPLPDGRLLTCLSPRGEILVGADEIHPIDALWTRGLALGPEEVAVGSSLYGRRLGRALLPGFVTFLDPAYRKIGRIRLPAAPTQIRRLDFWPF
ncbi:MAG TPA: hypothetical protein VGD66_05515 [Allosphingosinicella sp.]|jgi:hypothetical protein